MSQWTQISYSIRERHNHPYIRRQDLRTTPVVKTRLIIRNNLLDSIRFELLMACLQQRQRHSPHLRPQKNQRISLNKEQKKPTILPIQTLVLLRLIMEFRVLPHHLKEDKSGLPNKIKPDRHYKHIRIDPHRALQYLKEQGMLKDSRVQHLRDVG